MAKISELDTSKGADVLCEILPYVGAIIADEELTAEIRRKTGLDADSPVAEVYMAGLDKLAKIVPLVLKKHRNEAFGIVGAINDKSEAEVAAQPFLQTLAQILEILKDKAFVDFFKSLRHTENT